MPKQRKAPGHRVDGGRTTRKLHKKPVRPSRMWELGQKEQGLRFLFPPKD